MPSGIAGVRFDGLEGEDIRLALTLISLLTTEPMEFGEGKNCVVVHVQKVNKLSGRVLKGRKGQVVLDRVLAHCEMAHASDEAIDESKPFRRLEMIPGRRGRAIAGVAIFASPAWMQMRDRMIAATFIIEWDTWKTLGYRVGLYLALEGYKHLHEEPEKDRWSFMIEPGDRWSWAPGSSASMPISTFFRTYIDPAETQLNASVSALKWSLEPAPDGSVKVQCWTNRSLRRLAANLVTYKVEWERVAERVRQRDREERVAQERVAEAARREAADLKMQPRLPLD